jgi:hypothetical protein
MRYSNGTLPDPGLDPLDDPDGDGWNNAKEAAAGTNPFDANPPDGHLQPLITHSPEVWVEVNGIPELQSPEALTLTWPTIAGKQYTLMVSTDLIEWVQMGEETFISNGDDGSYGVALPNDDKMFWRVKIEDVDSDSDGLTDAEEAELGTDPDNSETISGYPDMWLATHFRDQLLISGLSAFDPGGDPDHDGLTNLEEYLNDTDPNNSDSDGDGITDGGENDQGTDPNDPQDTPNAEWFILTGDLDVDIEKTRSRTVTIPAGKKCLVIVATASEEYPGWTGPQSEYNDILSWNVQPTTGQAINESIDVNSRHEDWLADSANGVSLQGFSPSHIESSQIYTAPSDASLTVSINLSATNISDGYYPSTVMVGIFQLQVIQGNMPNIGVDANSTDLGGAREEEEIGLGGTAYITGEPAIPQLRVDFRGAPEAVSVEWRLEIRTERPTLRNTLDDRDLPATGFVTRAGDEEWDIGAELGESVGGRCALHYRINGDLEGEAEFFLRGKNPLDADARTYIDSSVGSSFTAYAWAIARHESRQGNRVYNQFNTQTTIAGTLNFGGPNGWGVCQIDRDLPPDDIGVSTSEVWNWHANVGAMNAKLVEKQTTYNRFIGYFRDSYGNQQNWSEPPTQYTEGATSLPAEAWGVMVLYNGAGGVPQSTTPTHPSFFQSPWVFNPTTGAWTFHDNQNEYAAGPTRVRPELEGTINTHE